MSIQNNQNRERTSNVLGFYLVFQEENDSPRKSNGVGEDDGLNQKKQIKMK